MRLSHDNGIKDLLTEFGSAPVSKRYKAVAWLCRVIPMVPFDFVYIVALSKVVSACVARVASSIIITSYNDKRDGMLSEYVLTCSFLDSDSLRLSCGWQSFLELTVRIIFTVSFLTERLALALVAVACVTQVLVVPIGPDFLSYSGNLPVGVCALITVSDTEFSCFVRVVWKVVAVEDLGLAGTAACDGTSQDNIGSAGSHWWMSGWICYSAALSSSVAAVHSVLMIFLAPDALFVGVVVVVGVLSGPIWLMTLTFPGKLTGFPWRCFDLRWWSDLYSQVTYILFCSARGDVVWRAWSYNIAAECIF